VVGFDEMSDSQVLTSDHFDEAVINHQLMIEK